MLESKNHEYEVRNYMETCVNELLDVILGNLGACKCENCRNDTMAIALNNLPPKYVVTKRGEMYTKINNLQQQHDIDIISAVAKATKIVGQNPRHDED